MIVYLLNTIHSSYKKLEKGVDGENQIVFDKLKERMQSILFDDGDGLDADQQGEIIRFQGKIRKEYKENYEKLKSLYKPK